MQNTFKRFSVIAGFAVLLIILIGNGFLTRREVGTQISTEARLAESRLLMLELEMTESLLKDAETGQRGYLYTGDSRYLAPYDVARTQIDSHFDELMRISAENPQQQSSIIELHALEQVKMGEISQTIALYRSGKADDARALVLSNYGLLTMDRFRGLIDQLERQEAGQEAVRNAHYQKTVRRTIASIYLASLLATVGLVMLAYFILREMSLRENHAQEIREREEWFRTTLTSIGDAVIVTDESGRVTFLNPVAEMLTGRDLGTAKGGDITEIFPIFSEVTGAPAENPVRRVITEGQVVGLANQTALRHVEGYLIPIEDSAAPIRDDKGRLVGVVLVFRDVSDARKAQELLRKTEKLAAAARLSATVAHEINNPLEAVANLVYLAKLSPGVSPEAVQHLSLAEEELERVAHLTRQTLGFYRESNEPERVDLPALIESVLRLYNNKLEAKSIHVEREFADCPTTIAVAGELKQVLANLLSNAMDAVDSGGTIRIGLKHSGEDEKREIELVIEDDGPGVPAENLERIFEPFFTTKKDVGTGLGLWVTREIVERHGGSIRVNSRNGRGSPAGAAFVIRLPYQPQHQAHAPAIVPVKQSCSSSPLPL
jgi:PAS domain S-box-containing protein